MPQGDAGGVDRKLHRPHRRPPEETVVHEIRIDRSKPLSGEPHLGHNRFHPDVEPVLEVEQGAEVVIETRDSLDGQITPSTKVSDVKKLDLGLVHPLTGPIYVKGAQPGDALEVEYLYIEPQPIGWTGIIPGVGFLRDVMTEPFLVHWNIRDGWATSEQLPGVRIPGAPFMGISGVAPSAKLLEEWTRREQRLLERGGAVFPPDPQGAVPGGVCGLQGVRTNPPRENGGNFDVKQLTKGAHLFLPVYTPGALFSTGDAHFAQGDGEVCVTAIEMSATVAVRFKVHKGLAASRKFTAPVFSHDQYYTDPKMAVPQRFLGVMGIPVRPDGENEGEDLSLACRNAVLNMMELLQERGFTREQAYIICSVAVDLKISSLVNVPNHVVSAILPEAIFES
jgi:formamidase